MDKMYVLINNHLRTAELLLLTRQKTLFAEKASNKDVKMELSRVGGLLRTVRRAERDMIYWFDPEKIVEEQLPLKLEQSYYDLAGIPETHRYEK